jgi:hypothetical protein
MSFRENIQVYSRLDIPRYLLVLQTEHGARPHPNETGSFLIDAPESPFCRPEQHGDHTAILGFNYAPLSSLLILALINHPELAPADDSGLLDRRGRSPGSGHARRVRPAI